MAEILCIDDDKLFCHLLARVSGLDIDHSYEKLPEKKKYRLIIIDINLGKKHGYEVYAELKDKVECNYVITSGLLTDTDIIINKGDHVIDKNNLLQLAKVGKLKEWMY